LYVLLGILILSFALRIYRSGTYGIYFDEKSTLLISQGICVEGANQRDLFAATTFTPQDFWRPKTMADFVEANIRGDIGNSPAYYGVLWIWIKLFGLSDFSIRFPSVLFSTFTVLMLYAFVRRHFRSESLALLSAGIAAIEPFFVAYSHMARNYSMTFFLTLLATHLFLLILEKEGQGRKTTGLYVGYCLTVATSVLSHYLTVTVFLCHGLYALVYLRNAGAWLRLALSAVVALSGVSLWFLFGGGQYTFKTLAYQAAFYRNLALTNPLNNGFGIILPATPKNVAVRALPIFSDLVFFTNGLGAKVAGYRNLALALGSGLAATLLLHRYYRAERPPVLAWAGFPLILAFGLPVYTVNPGHFLVLAASLPLFYLLYRGLRDDVTRTDRSRVVFLVLLSLVPTLFLLFMAFRAGHTYGITQRYSGFSFPYVTILVAIAFRRLIDSPGWYRWPLAVAVGLQLFFIGQLLQRIYADSDPKYTYFSKPRIANPLATAAERIQQLYQPGDTVVYPSLKKREYTEIDRNGMDVSVLDAQITNLYLPKTATYPQRIDPDERDRILLVRGATGQRITIYDLKGLTFRY